MFGFLAATALLATPAQGSPLGQISKEQLFQEIRAMGFVVLEERDSTLLVDGKTRVHLGAGMHLADNGAPFVGGATGRLEFDLPKSFPKKELQEWMKRQDIGKSVTSGSFLGGRVYVQGWLFTEKTTRPELKVNIRELIDACRKVTQLVESGGGKASATIHALGTSPYEPDFKLDWIEQEDMDYMRDKLEWGHTSGTVIRGWVTGGVVNGVPVVFTGGFEAPLLFLTYMPAEPNPAKLARYLSNPANLDWADYQDITEKSVYIQKRLDFPNGITVRGLENHIVDFAKKVRALDLI